ncbi:hypothetical protein GCM10020255_036150 [Rhodococcus baikonurensis]
MTRRQIRGLGAAVLVSAFLTACGSEDPEGPDPRASTTTRSAPAVAFGEPETVADGLDAPWSIAFHGRTPLVSERDSARILEVDGSGITREMGVVDGVSPRGEGGLLGIALHENRLYVYLTANGENRIERFDITGDPGALGLGRPRRFSTDSLRPTTTTEVASPSVRMGCCTPPSVMPVVETGLRTSTRCPGKSFE